MNKPVYIKIHYCLLIIMAFTLPFSSSINSILILLLFGNWFLHINLANWFKSINQNNVLYILISFYLLCIIGISYSSNLSIGLGVLVKRISLLLLPIVFSGFTYNKRILSFVSIAFILAMFCSVTYTIASVYLVHGLNYSDYSSDHLRDFLTQPMDLHPTYFSIYVLFAVFLLINLIKEYWKSLNIFHVCIVVFTIIYFLVFVLLLAARMPLIAFGVIVILSGIYFLLKHKLYGYFLMCIFLVISGCYIIFSSSIFNQRFLEIKETKWEPPVGIHYNSTNLRIGIFRCTFSGVKQHWLLGTGTGDMQDQLNACYRGNGYSEVMYKNKYNTHSIYLDSLLMLGLVGLSVLLYSFMFYLQFAIKKRAFVYLIFLVLFLICGISESLLNTQKGIVFFSFFNTFFIYYFQSDMNSESKNKSIVIA